MKISAVLFDLDGTLLPMEQDVFVRSYMKRLATHLAPRGYMPERLIETIWSGTAAMVKNSGDRTNEAVFWDHFASIYGEESRRDLPLFEEFYENEFPKVRESCGFDARARDAVTAARRAARRVVLATNPIFPAVATRERIRWAGLDEADFEFVTTYENSRHSKPNPDYYRDILARIGLRAEECLMVGNDVGEDMIARTLGMKVFLVTDNIINRTCEDVSVYPSGDLGELCRFLDALD